MQYVDASGVICQVNVALLEILGYFDKQELYRNKVFSDFFVDQVSYKHLVARLVAGRVVNNFITDMLGAEGRPVRVIIDVSCDLVDGSITHSRWFIRPIEPRELPTARAVEDTLDVSEKIAQMSTLERDAYFERINDFFDNAPVGVHFVGLNGVMMRANRAELTLLGYQDEPDSYIGHHVRRIHHEPMVVETLLERLIAGIPVISYEAYLKRRDGNVQPVLIYSGLRLKGGKFQNTRCFLFDNPTPSRSHVESHVAGYAWEGSMDEEL
jgi:PAS domain S-box-containing protein